MLYRPATSAFPLRVASWASKCGRSVEVVERTLISGRMSVALALATDDAEMRGVDETSVAVERL